MKSRLRFTTLLLGLLALLARPVGLATTQENKSQPGRYTVTDLGILPGGVFSQAANIANNGLITGVAAAPDGNHENFCAHGTGLKCLPFLWHDKEFSK